MDIGGSTRSHGYEGPFVPMDTKDPFVPMDIKDPFVPMDTKDPFVPMDTKGPFVPFSPRVSTIGSFLMMACLLAIRITPRARVTVTTIGRPSGMAATAKLITSVGENGNL